MKNIHDEKQKCSNSKDHQRAFHQICAIHAIHDFVEPSITVIERKGTSCGASSDKGRAQIFQIFARESFRNTWCVVSNNQSYFTWYVKYFCTLACWILLTVTFFSSLCFIEAQWLEKVNKEWFQHKQTSCVFQGNSHPFILFDMKDAVWHVQH